MKTDSAAKKATITNITSADNNDALVHILLNSFFKTIASAVFNFFFSRAYTTPGKKKYYKNKIAFVFIISSYEMGKSCLNRW
jgi:ACR3 family arsenite efflux pump ArsB